MTYALRRKGRTRYKGDVELPEGASFELMVESTFSPFCLVDAQGIITWVGPRIGELLGAPPEAIVGKHLLEHVAPEFHEVALSAYEDYIGEAVPIDRWSGPPMDLELVRADGTHLPCEISAAVGTQFGFEGLILQIRRSQGTLRLYDAVDALAVGAPVAEILTRLAALCEHDMPGSSVTIAWAWDGDRFRHAVPELEQLPVSVTDVEPKDTPWRVAMATGEVQGGESLSSAHPELAERIADSGFAACWVIPITVNGAREASAAIIVWRSDEGGPTPHHQTIPQRISRLVSFALQSARQREMLHEAARTDQLTGLDNRLALRTSWPRSEHAVVLFCDLDGFKPVNDRYGHDLGDRVLAIVARRLSEALRGTDRIARWGGDEFVVVTSTDGDREAETLAQRLIETVNEPIVVDGHEIRIGLSVGIAPGGADTHEDELISRADDALRQAKAAGKNRWLRAG